MPKLHSHYDNLKVARDAPAEVIRAAYRSLSAKYHPDRNPGDPEAVRIMATINVAYEILSDPERRKQHDEWLANIEVPQADVANKFGPQNPIRNSAQSEDEFQSRVRKSRPGDYLYLFLGIVVGGFLGLVLHLIARMDVLAIAGFACAGAVIAMRIRMNLPSQKHLYRDSRFRDW